MTYILCATSIKTIKNHVEYLYVLFKCQQCENFSYGSGSWLMNPLTCVKS